MPSRVEALDPPPPANSKLLGVNTSLLYNGSKFKGHQKSRGNEYDVEVILQVCFDHTVFRSNRTHVMALISLFLECRKENSYLCGYLTIAGLTEQYPTITTFFEGEIISARYPFLTRKWEADEDVDRKHWVGLPYG